MPNVDNLIPLNKVSKEVQREIQEKGRQANKKKWQEKKMLKELLELALSEETETGNKYIDITKALITQAEDGNVKAYEVIRDTLGQKPVEVQQIIETPIINDNID